MAVAERQPAVQTEGRGWPQRWSALRELAGAASDEIRRSYRLHGVHRTPDTLTLQQCLTTPDHLVAQVSGEAGGNPNPRELRARLSVLQQALALDVIAPLSLRLMLDGKAPALTAADIFLLPAGGDRRWHWRETATELDADSFLTTMADHANRWYPVFRQAFGVSPGAYWSSVGLGLGMPFSALYDKAPPAALCALASEWLEAFDCDAARFIDWIPARFDGRTFGIPQRRGCCLKYQLPQGGYCGTCGVYRKERLGAITPAPRAPATPGQWSPAE